jgi:hypothetical protein
MDTETWTLRINHITCFQTRHVVCALYCACHCAFLSASSLLGTSCQRCLLDKRDFNVLSSGGNNNQIGRSDSYFMLRYAGRTHAPDNSLHEVTDSVGSPGYQYGRWCAAWVL